VDYVIYISGFSRSGIHGELIRCSYGKTKKDPNISNSYMYSWSTQTWNGHVYRKFCWSL